MFGGRDVHAVIEVFVVCRVRALGDEISVTHSDRSLDSVVDDVLVRIEGLDNLEITDVLLPLASQIWVTKHLPDVPSRNINNRVSLDNGNSVGFLKVRNL